MCGAKNAIERCSTTIGEGNAEGKSCFDKAGKAKRADKASPSLEPPPNLPTLAFYISI